MDGSSTRQAWCKPLLFWVIGSQLALPWEGYLRHSGSVSGKTKPNTASGSSRMHVLYNRLSSIRSAMLRRNMEARRRSMGKTMASGTVSETALSHWTVDVVVGPICGSDIGYLGAV
ncbi:hypothetical protein DFP73DRAFT_534033, partial [Morchella snyderi]